MTDVLSVHVAHHVRGELCMVECRGEDFTLFFGAAFHADARHGSAPCFPGPFLDLVEVEFRDFGVEVQFGIFDADCRDADCGCQCVRIRCKFQKCLTFSVIVTDYRAREPGVEMDCLVFDPALGASHAADFGVGDLPQRALVHPVVGQCVIQVNEDVPAAAAIDVAVDAGVLCSSEFRHESGFRELHCPISRLRGFVLMIERVRVNVIAGSVFFRCIRRRVEEDVGQVGASGTAQVRMGESDYGIVIIMVAGAGIPAFRPGVRAQLHHAVRSRSSRICVSVESCADHRISLCGLLCAAA